MKVGRCGWVKWRNLNQGIGCWRGNSTNKYSRNLFLWDKVLMLGLNCLWDGLEGSILSMLSLNTITSIDIGDVGLNNTLSVLGIRCFDYG